MTCDEVAKGEIVERYLLGQLDEPERDAFEEHYFECARCSDELRTYEALQAELSRTRDALVAAPGRSWMRQWAWLPAAAVVLIGVSVVIRQGLTTGGERPPIAADTPPDRPAGPGSTPAQPPPIARASLDDLARFEPPRYVQGRLRGADAATAKFQAAMEQYQRQDFASARATLREASTLDPEAAHIAFFLGITSLLAGQPDEAAETLRRTVALGDSPYLEEAHFYLAKAYVKLARVDDAIGELDRAIQLRGDHEADARAFRSQLEAFKSTSR